MRRVRGPNASITKSPPTVQRTPINVIAVRNDESNPRLRSMGKSVATLASSAIRYSGVLMFSQHEPQPMRMTVFLANSHRADRSATRAMCAELSLRPQTEMMASTTLAAAIGKKRSACAQSSVPSFRPIALKKSRFQKFNRYCTNNCRRTTEIINAIRSHARHADRPRQNPDALCQNRVSRRFSSGARYASGDISSSLAISAQSTEAAS